MAVSLSCLPSKFGPFHSTDTNHQTPMKKLAVLLLTLLHLKAFAQDRPDQWVGIDCGSNHSTATNGLIWLTDDAFIQTGTNHLVPEDNNRSLAYLNTLRAFTDQNKNCYTLPALTRTRYFIRAVFFYANYDNLNNPPAFDLQIDGNKMVTVSSSADEVDYYEIIYWSQHNNISMCLARTRVGEFPFISSLEAWRIPSTMYMSMHQGLAWINTYRYNYGAESWITGYPFDTYNRIWQPLSTPGTLNISADPGTTLYDATGESPPDSSILDAIQAPDEKSSILLTFSPVQTNRPTYIEAYFTEPQLQSSGMRWFDIYVNGKGIAMSVVPTSYQCTSEKLFGQVSSSNLTIELRPSGNTTLPPVISAIEIYSSSDPLITSGTHQDDLNGLATITRTFEQLKGWSGDPCLPADTVWQWLGCAGSNPPRVTSIYLSRYGLNGSLPDFSQMQALEDIDVSNNSLSGQIPRFLGQIPKLKKLNLSYNDFSGELPASIRNKTGLVYDITGNPNVNASGKGKSSKTMIIGLAVGIPLAIIILILAIIFWQIQKPANQGPGEAPEHEIGNGAEQESFMITSASTDQLMAPPPRPTAPPMGATPEDCNDDVDYLSVSTVAAKPDPQSMIPEMNLDELELLIDENAKVGEMSDEDDCVAVEGYGAMAGADQSMVPDIDLEELDEIIRHEKERADEMARHEADD